MEYFRGVLTLVGVFGGWPSPVYWGLWIAGLALLTGIGAPSSLKSSAARGICSWTCRSLSLRAKHRRKWTVSPIGCRTVCLFLEADRFLRADGPSSQSAYPGFPYNVTFLFYAVSQVAGNLSRIRSFSSMSFFYCCLRACLVALAQDR